MTSLYETTKFVAKTFEKKAAQWGTVKPRTFKLQSGKARQEAAPPALNAFSGSQEPENSGRFYPCFPRADEPPSERKRSELLRLPCSGRNTAGLKARASVPVHAAPHQTNERIYQMLSYILEQLFAFVKGKFVPFPTEPIKKNQFAGDKYSKQPAFSQIEFLV